MNPVDYAALSPMIILLFGSLALLLIECFAEKWTKRFASQLTMSFLIAAFFAAYFAPPSTNTLLTGWLHFDSLGRFFTLFFLSIGLAVALLSSNFFNQFQAPKGEYYFLLLSSLLGLIFIGSAADFLTLFLGIETLSISLYVLCGYMKNSDPFSESSLKYFLMGSIAAAFLLYGIAFIYGAVGTTRFDDLLSGYQNMSSSKGPLFFLTGIVFITFAFSFEAAIVPLQAWAPDVYEGASTPVTAFMAVGTKSGGICSLYSSLF